MAITNVPQISGPTFGGVIYGLNVSQSFSSEPSKLTINVVNQNGIYTTPILNKPEQVSFSTFKFDGIIWSYEIKESADEKILNVTLVDNSIILDRYYVLLWKRGFLGYNGTDKTIEKTFDFGDETILLPTTASAVGGLPYTKFIEKRLGIQKITRTSKSLAPLGYKRINSLILVGHEKFADTECDIPDTYYTFNDLKNALIDLKISLIDAPVNSTWKATHEGTLREVLSSWCADLGFDFYWDFYKNSIKFYDVSVGITSNLPDSTASNIISKEISENMEGTFRQYGIAYTAKPKDPIKTLSKSINITYSRNVSPINISYFGNRIGSKISLFSKKNKWGGRTEDQFILAGMVGYVSPKLRDLYCFQEKNFEALGFKLALGSVDKAKIIDFLRKKGYAETINNLEKFDGQGLPSYSFEFLSRDEQISQKWYEIEQDMLTYHGRFFRIPDKPGSFFYCNANYTIDISIDVDPSGSLKEENTIEFAGKSIYDRGGRLSHDSSVLQDLLQLSQLTEELENCAPKFIDLKEAGLFEQMVTSKLISESNRQKINTLVMYPNTKFIEKKLGFKKPILSTGTNDMETTWLEEQQKNSSNAQKNCQQYENSLEKGSCASAEETARKKAIIVAGGSTGDEDTPPDNQVSGLTSKQARSCFLQTRLGSAKFYLPSHSPLKVLTRYSLSINKISSVNRGEFFWTVGSPGSANDVAEIRIANENITDPSEDTYQKRRNTELIRPADSFAVTPTKSIKYVFAGSPQNISLTPSNGLSNLDISLSSDGFTTSATFSTRPPKPSKQNNIVRYINSQFNRASYNAS